MLVMPDKHLAVAQHSKTTHIGTSLTSLMHNSKHLYMPKADFWTHCKQEFVRPRWPYDMRPSVRAEKYIRDAAHKRKQKFFYFGCSLVRRFYCKIKNYIR